MHQDENFNRNNELIYYAIHLFGEEINAARALIYLYVVLWHRIKFSLFHAQKNTAYV